MTVRRRATHGVWGHGRIVRVGKVRDAAIPVRATGSVEIYDGTPGQEVDTGAAGQFANACPRTVSQGCWVVLIGEYIVQAIPPALIIKTTLTSNLSAGGSSIVPSIDGFFFGSAPPMLSAMLTNAGFGYTSPPTVTISGGGGSGATAACAIDAYGLVVSITITNPGAGYTSLPTMSFSGGGGSGAAALAQPLTIYASFVQTLLIASGSNVIAIWNDVLERYEVLDWNCQTG